MGREGGRVDVEVEFKWGGQGVKESRRCRPDVGRHKSKRHKKCGGVEDDCVDVCVMDVV